MLLDNVHSTCPSHVFNSLYPYFHIDKGKWKFKVELDNWTDVEYLCLVFRLVFNYGKEDVLGKHEAHVRCVEYSYTTGMLKCDNSSDFPLFILLLVSNHVKKPSGIVRSFQLK